MPYKISELIPIKPFKLGGKHLEYEYHYIFNRLPSIYTLKYNWLRDPRRLKDFNVKYGYIDIHYTTLYYDDNVKARGYTYQYIPTKNRRDENLPPPPPKCKLIIDPVYNEIYVSPEELERLMKDYNVDKSKAIEMCQRQATILLNLIAKASPEKSMKTKWKIKERIFPHRIKSIKEEVERYRRR